MKSWFYIVTLSVVCIIFSCRKNNFYEKVVVFDPETSLDDKIRRAAHVIPTPQQLAWQKLELTAFIHFGINTFTEREWGDGTESPSLFSPTELDAMQWVKALRDGGMKMVILTAKHHDGFCLWPTKTTSHSVASSPWRDGKGDLVLEVKDACEALGMKFGVYLSPWDRNAQSYGDSPRYNEFFRQQLTELLSWYGTVDEVWFDGACGEGPNGKRQEYDWESYYEVIHRLQPNAVVAIMGEDVRWVGTETGYGRSTEWSVTAYAPGGRPEMEAINESLGLNAMTPDLGSRELMAKADRLFWYPAEVDVSIRPGWFYHQKDDYRVKSLAHLVDIYFNSVGMNAVLLLNVPPDKRGLIHEIDVARLKELRMWLDKTFSKNLMYGAQTDAKRAKAAIDINNDTYWKIKKFPSSAVFQLNGEKTFDVIELQENIAKGQRVEGFSVEVMENGSWKEIATGTTIGYKRLLRFAPVTTDRIRVTITEARYDALISNICIYLSAEILSDPIITRNKEGDITISSEAKHPIVTFTLDGSEPSEHSTLFTTPFPLPQGGMVKARAFINNFELGSNVITETFDIAPTKWKVVEASKGFNAFPAEFAIDGDYNTMWHTPWFDNPKPHPHSISIDLGEELLIRGFSYTPRNDGNFSGTVLTYSFAVSIDGKSWNRIVDRANFDNMLNNPSRQFVRFQKPARARFFKFTSHASIYDENWVSVAELEVITRSW